MFALTSFKILNEIYTSILLTSLYLLKRLLEIYMVSACPSSLLTCHISISVGCILSDLLRSSFQFSISLHSYDLPTFNLFNVFLCQQICFFIGQIVFFSKSACFLFILSYSYHFYYFHYPVNILNIFKVSFRLLSPLLGVEILLFTSACSSSLLVIYFIVEFCNF